MNPISAELSDQSTGTYTIHIFSTQLPKDSFENMLIYVKLI